MFRLASVVSGYSDMYFYYLLCMNILLLIDVVKSYFEFYFIFSFFYSLVHIINT